MSRLPSLDELRAALRVKLGAILDKAIAEGRIRVPPQPLADEGATK